jgi:hypothetical protein
MFVYCRQNYYLGCISHFLSRCSFITCIVIPGLILDKKYNCEVPHCMTELCHLFKG